MTETPQSRDDWHMEIGVSFRHNPKIYSFVATGTRLSIGDRVLVRTEKGVDMGEVMELKGRIMPARADELMPVVRKATADDHQHIAEQQKREKQALEICAEAIEKHGLPMKLIDANLSFDNTRLVFFFSADGRVDFRELVRDLARTFRMRIELRQIGVRDEAKLLGGLGPCGRRLCCKTFMREFEPVGIRVAKDQGLALNPSKISGLCDRLMCCLLFEHETYCALRAELPERGDRVRTEHGPGTVREVVLLKEELRVALDDGTEITVRASEAGPLVAEAEAGDAVRERAEQPQPRGQPDEKRARDRHAERRQSGAGGEQDSPGKAAQQPASAEGEQARSKRGGRSRRRRPRRKRSSGGGQEAGQQDQQQPQQQAQQARQQPQQSGAQQSQQQQDGQSGSGKKRSSRRRGGGRRRSRRKSSGQGDQQSGGQGGGQPGQRKRDGGST